MLRLGQTLGVGKDDKCGGDVISALCNGATRNAFVHREIPDVPKRLGHKDHRVPTRKVARQDTGTHLG